MTTKSLLPALALALTFGCTKMESSPKSPPVFSPLPANGQERGNGTDVSFDSDQAAWFVGASKVINYCVEMDPSFGPSKEVVLKSIDESFKEWSIYHLSRSQYKLLATDAQYVSSCSATTDVTFKMGGPAPNNDPISRHVGLAVKTSYDPVRAWGQGYVWLPSQGSIPNEVSTLPNWTLASLKGVLLHEIGHIYGVSHINGTIMEEGAGRITLDSDPNAIIPSIDGLHFLLPPSTGAIGALGLSPAQNPNLVDVPFGNENKNFEMLTGRIAEGPVSAAMQFSNDLNEGEIQVSDWRGTQSFKLESYIWEKASPIAEVKNAFITRIKNLYYIDSSFATVKGFTLKTRSGQTLTLILFYNQPTAFGHTGPNGYSTYETGGITLKVQTAEGLNYLFTTSVRERVASGTRPPPTDPDTTPDTGTDPNIELSLAPGGLIMPVANQTCVDKVNGTGERSASANSLSFPSLRLKWNPSDRHLYVGTVKVTVSSPIVQGGSQVFTLAGDEIAALMGTPNQIVSPVNDDGSRGNKTIITNRPENRSGFPDCSFTLGGVAFNSPPAKAVTVHVKIELLGQSTFDDGSDPKAIRSTFSTTADYF